MIQVEEDEYAQLDIVLLDLAQGECREEEEKLRILVEEDKILKERDIIDELEADKMRFRHRMIQVEKDEHAQQDIVLLEFAQGECREEEEKLRILVEEVKEREILDELEVEKEHVEDHTCYFHRCRCLFNFHMRQNRAASRRLNWFFDCYTDKDFWKKWRKYRLDVSKEQDDTNGIYYSCDFYRDLVFGYDMESIKAIMEKMMDDFYDELKTKRRRQLGDLRKKKYDERRRLIASLRAAIKEEDDEEDQESRAEIERCWPLGVNMLPNWHM